MLPSIDLFSLIIGLAVGALVTPVGLVIRWLYRRAAMLWHKIAQGKA